MSNISLHRETIEGNLLFISGLTRSGKALLCPIVSSFENTEKVNVNFFLEQIPFLNHLDKINDEASIYLLKTGISMMLYDNAIGRNVNFRKDDYTSVWKYRNPKEYIDRLSIPDGDSAIKKIEDDLRLFPMMVHNGLINANLLFSAYPSLKMIHMQRNPVHIVFSWIKKGYGDDFYAGKRTSTPVIKYKSDFLPYFTYGWEDKYYQSNAADRVIYSIDHIRKQHKDTFEKLDKNIKKKILFVDHQSLLTKTNKNISIITKFLKTKISKDTPLILKQENCPRDESLNTPGQTSKLNHQDKLKNIKSLASSDGYQTLMKMHEAFISEDLPI